jgi:hypothetical protein
VKRFLKALMVGALVGVMALAPGCFLCQYRPQVQAVSYKLDKVMADFNVVYPILQAAVQTALGLNLPNAQAMAVFSATIKLQADRIYFEILCPTDSDVVALHNIVAQVEQETLYINQAIVKFKVAHPEVK